jgi:hypothetical protein
MLHVIPLTLQTGTEGQKCCIVKVIQRGQQMGKTGVWRIGGMILTEENRKTRRRRIREE